MHLNIWRESRLKPTNYTTVNRARFGVLITIYSGNEATERKRT